MQKQNHPCYAQHVNLPPRPPVRVLVSDAVPVGQVARVRDPGKGAGTMT